MHSCCQISGIAQNDRSPRGTSELDKHPAFKLRRTTQVHENRLSLHLAYLDQRCQEVTSRMTHSMKQLNQSLKRMKLSDERLCAQSNENGTKYGHRSTTRFNDNQCSRNSTEKYDSPSRESLLVKNEPKSRNMTDKNYRNVSTSDSRLPKIESNHHQNNNLTNNRKNRIPHAIAKIARNKYSPKKSCHFGCTPDGSKCLHFPCRQPETYHSLGFRLDDSSTNQWMTWAELKRSKIDLPDYNTAPNTRASHAGDSDGGSELRRWCSLPMDFESRKQRLHEEIAKRRLQNLANKPKCWETNYGEITPYKILANPVRLHPLQMTTK